MGVPAPARRQSVTDLAQVLADLSALRALYKHFHWRVRGRHFIMLHELYDKHAGEVTETIDAVAERMQMLGGESTAWPADIARMTRLAAPARGEAVSDATRQLNDLLAAHGLILEFAHEAAERAEDAGDPGTADLLVSEVIRAGQMQAWFIGEHLDEPRSARS